MSLLRFLGLGGAAGGERESDTIRRIAGELDHLPPEQAKYLASFAYVLARLANADLAIDATETAEMERIVHRIAGLSDAESALVVQIAVSQARNLGGTQDYLVTRQFKQITNREQRADGTIRSEESAEIAKIGEELGFTRAEANSLRAEYRDKLAEFQR
jgi:hypothetical protein